MFFIKCTLFFPESQSNCLQAPSMAATASNSLSLKEYLKRYDSGANDAKTTKKKKKKKVSKPNSTTAGVLIVDEDPVWQKTVQVEESEPESPGTNPNPRSSLFLGLLSNLVSDFDVQARRSLRSRRTSR